ncbi:MAG: S1 RNA-binding domain-containing protein [Calditrichia bacterium]
MKKEIIINSTNEDTRIAILENDKLVEIFVERPDNERMVGDIYKGRVRRVVKGMHAAFINIGFEQDGFLHFSDMGSDVMKSCSMAARANRISILPICCAMARKLRCRL